MSQMKTIKMTRKQATSILKYFPDYRGRKIKVEITPTITLWDLYWSGGTRAEYTILRSDGTCKVVPTHDPWSERKEGVPLPLPDNVVVVRHLISCGKDTGLTIYVNPNLMPKWLEGGVE